MFIGLHVQYPQLCQVLMKLEFSQQIFEKYSNIKFHENATSGKRDVPYGETDGRTERHYEASSWFRSFANAPKKRWPKFADQPRPSVIWGPSRQNT